MCFMETQSSSIPLLKERVNLIAIHVRMCVGLVGGNGHFILQKVGSNSYFVISVYTTVHMREYRV